jgi:hypothetical protein
MEEVIGHLWLQEKKHQTTFDFSSSNRKQHNDYEFSNAESK